MTIGAAGIEQHVTNAALQELDDNGMKSLAEKIAKQMGASSATDVDVVCSALKDAKETGKNYTYFIPPPSSRPLLIRSALQSSSEALPPQINQFSAAACFITTLVSIYQKLQKFASMIEQMEGGLKAGAMGMIGAQAKCSSSLVLASAKQQSDIYKLQAQAAIANASLSGVQLMHTAGTGPFTVGRKAWASAKALVKADKGAGLRSAKQAWSGIEPKFGTSPSQVANEKFKKQYNANGEYDQSLSQLRSVRDTKLKALKDHKPKDMAVASGETPPPDHEKIALEKEYHAAEKQVTQKERFKEEFITREQTAYQEKIKLGYECLKQAIDAYKNWGEATLTIVKSEADAALELSRAAMQILETSMGAMGEAAKKFGDIFQSLGQAIEKAAEMSKRLAQRGGSV